MSFSYDPDIATDKDRVRLRIGDTDETDPLLQDGEINSVLEDSGGSVYRAAAELCRNLSAKFAREAGMISRESGLHDDAQAKADRYLKLAAEYDERASSSVASPFAGGISASDKSSRSEDSSSVQPAFSRDLHDAPSGTPPFGGSCPR